MKALIIIIVALAAGLAAGYLLFAGEDGPQIQPEGSVKQQYTCGMHPQIVRDEPGYCPICGMKLTLKKDGSSKSSGILIDPTTTQNMGIVTSVVSRHRLARTIRTFGKVTVAQPNVHSVNVKFDGWVERLYVDREGAYVREGQPLFEVYSPDLVAAQREFQVAVQAAGGNNSNLLEAARSRLANWDISDDQIAHLRDSGEITRTMVVRSPGQGVVMMKRVSQGDHVEPGMELYQIADLSSVWVVAQVYEQDLPFVRLKQAARVAFPNQDVEPREGTVSYIAPYLDERGQVEVRVELDNRDSHLKTEMYAEVSLVAELPGERIAVPRTAVINSGTRQLAYVALGDGKFEPRVITVGASGDGDLVEIRSGLAEGEQVVVSGQFMLDSETRLNEALSTGGISGHDHGQAAPMNPGTLPSAENMAEHTMAPPSEPPSDELVATGGHDIYTCPMPVHYHVLQYGPGKCPECGMDLVPLAETTNTKAYVCPMAEDRIVQDHPGTCPKCGMNLVRYRAEDPDDK